MMRVRVGLLALVLLAGCGKQDDDQAGNVDFERWRNAQSEPGQWLALGRTWKADRYAPLGQIHAGNAGQLGFAWEYAARTRRGRVDPGHESTPIVVDGVMYASGPWGAVYAVDAKTGEERWRYDPEVDGSYWRRACCGAVNRGLQVWQGRVYVGTLDGFLVALDAAEGKELWKVDTLIDRETRSYTITGPAQVAKDVVVIGNSGAEFGVRGYVTAYDLATGEQKWRFFTVPGDPAEGPPEHPEMALALETWDPESHWESGLGGTVWGEMTYDPELDLLYIGTGNSSPYPIWHRSPSGGDNLFLASIVALDPDTGRMAWYYQTTPGEIWDYTATQNMILAELEIDGRMRKVIMQAPKNGFFYVLDRESGEFLSAEPFVFVNWASRIDENGRPVVNPEAVYKDKPAVVFPSGAGAHNWQPMAYSQDTGLVYIPARQQGMLISNPPGPYEWQPGRTNTGSSAVFSFILELLPPEQRAGVEAMVAQQEGIPGFGTEEMLIAYDPVAQKERWRVPLGSSDFSAGGVLTTAGNLVIQGTGAGFLKVYSADGGELLQSIEVGTGIMAAPVSYEVDGEQYIAVLAGFGGALAGIYPKGTSPYTYQNYGRLLAFKLNGAKTPLPPVREKQLTPEPPTLEALAEANPERGAMHFSRCASCHGGRGEERLSAYPDLFRLTASTHQAFETIVHGGMLAANGMAGFADVLSKEDVADLQAFLLREQRTLWKEEQAGHE